jgi:hypothetical protein
MSAVTSRRGFSWAPLPVAAALACWLYRPWQARAFDVLDFSEFLPLLNAGHGVGGRLALLTHYYAGIHGRLNVLSYAALAIKWTWLGSQPLLWQALRAALLCGLAGLTYLLLRRLAAGVFASALGAVLLLFSYSAALPWVRLTMGEPLGLACALLAAVSATRHHRQPGWGNAIVAGGLLAAAILAKEMLVFWVPVVMLIALTRGPDGRLSTWRRDPATSRFLMATGFLATAAFVPVLLVARITHAEGYAATYGSAPLRIDRLLELFQRQFLPWPITGRGDGMLMLGSALAFLGVIGLGIRTGLTDPAWRRHCQLVLSIGIGLPLLGALAYLPWPVYSPFYGYPFLFGPALLLATALTVLATRSPRAARGAAVVAVVAIVLVIPATARLAANAAAQQVVMTELAHALPEAQRMTRIIAAVPQLPAQAWQGMGPSLVRYANATIPGLVLPPAEDVLCADAARLLQSGKPGIALISLSNTCGSIPGAGIVVRSAYWYWRWDPPGLGEGDVRGELLVIR